MVEIIVFVDPAKSSRSTSCEVGIVATGIDDRGVVHGLADASEKLSAAQWPARAHDLRERMEREFPGARMRMGVENNAGGEMPAELLRAEEKIRRLRSGKPGVSVVEIVEVTSRPRDSKVKRAGPIVALAKSDQVRMLPDLGVLEGQLSNLTDAAPGNDRADAFVHGARAVAGLGEAAEEKPDPRETFRGLAEAQRHQPPPAYRGDRV
jgi:phage terminase large subunit-like protein